MSQIDVSVIVPCYNTEKFLDQALASALENDRVAMELICVNDGSTDGSLAIMRKHEAADARVIVIDKPNGGYGSGVNAGLARATGEYIAILEPDDWVEPHMYDELVEFARSFDEAPDIVKSSYWRIWMPTTPKERRYHCSYYQRPMPEKQPFTLAECPRLIRHHPSVWSALYRRGFLDEHGIRMREVPGAGWVDNPWLIETMAQAKRIVYTDTPYYNYREDLPGSSSVGRTWRLSFERWNDMCDIFDRLGVDDEGIRDAFNTVGFRYTDEPVDKGALGTPELAEEIRGIYARMGADSIERLTNIAPASRRRALEMSGRAVPRLSEAAYIRALAGEFFYSWRTNGLPFALGRVRGFIARRLGRGGADPTKTSSASI